jgi:hypothetical protein
MMTEIRIAFLMNILENCFCLLNDYRHGGALSHTNCFFTSKEISSAYLSWSTRTHFRFRTSGTDVTLNTDQLVLFVTLPCMGSVAGPLQSKTLPGLRRGPRMVITGVEALTQRYTACLYSGPHRAIPPPPVTQRHGM